MQKTFKDNLAFFIGFIIYLTLGASILLNFPKGEFEKLVNTYHQTWADFFFAYYTFVGDGIFYLLIISILYFFNKRFALLGLVCFALTGLVAQGLKLLIFTDAPRPMAFFGEKSGLHLVEGVEIHLSNSFPSGHSITAFSVFCLLALLFQNKNGGIMLLLFAILASFSRVYLMQHFFLDTYFGAIIGTVLTLISYQVFQNLKLIDRK